VSDAFVMRNYDPAADYDAVTALWQRSGLALYPIDTRERLARTAAANPGLFLVVTDGGRIVAAVLGTTDSRVLWVQHLAVDADYRRHGLGGRLLDALEARARERDLGVMMLLVLEDNAGAIQFYEKRGWLSVPNVRFMVLPIR
jgi:ribosomal protein S18 acetylase RimI-like enzyme